jgi:hypothetical protein
MLWFMDLSGFSTPKTVYLLLRHFWVILKAATAVEHRFTDGQDSNIDIVI